MFVWEDGIHAAGICKGEDWSYSRPRAISNCTAPKSLLTRRANPRLRKLEILALRSFVPVTARGSSVGDVHPSVLLGHR